jgi:hypothetical protein
LVPVGGGVVVCGVVVMDALSDDSRAKLIDLFPLIAGYNSWLRLLAMIVYLEISSWMA